jgi:hypothetical protein
MNLLQRWRNWPQRPRYKLADWICDVRLLREAEAWHKVGNEAAAQQCLDLIRLPQRKRVLTDRIR